MIHSKVCNKLKRMKMHQNNKLKRMKMHENNKRNMMLTETERNEQKKFKLQQGGCSSNQGVCRNKKVGLQKTCWAWCTGWVGSNWVGPRRTDPIGEVYMGCKPIFLHFHPLFLSLLPLFSVLSPHISSSSPMGVGWRRGGRPPC